MSFEHQTTILFSQVDSVGIVFFARIFEHCHAALEATLEAGGMPLHQILDGGEWAMPLVHAEADYKRPMRLGDKITVQVALAGRGGGSLRFGYTLLGADGELRATAELVHAVIDRQRFKSRRVPQEILDVLRRAGLAIPE